MTVIGVGYGWAQVGFLSHKSDYSLFERSRKDMKLFGYYQQYINGQRETNLKSLMGMGSREQVLYFKC